MIKLDIDGIIKNLKGQSAPLSQQGKYAVIILSMPTEEKLYKNFIQQSHFIAIVDGAANYVKVNDLDSQKTILIGDCDSISKDIKQKFSKMVLEDPSVDTNDFEKAINHIKKNCPEIDKVFVFGGLGGRYDHLFYNVGLTYREGPLLILLDTVNIIFTVNNCTLKNCQLVDMVGIHPLNGPGKIKTKNLHWDVDDEFKFSGFQSSSNYIEDKAKDVVIECEPGIKMTVVLTY